MKPLELTRNETRLLNWAINSSLNALTKSDDPLSPNAVAYASLKMIAAEFNDALRFGRSDTVSTISASAAAVGALAVAANLNSPGIEQFSDTLTQDNQDEPQHAARAVAAAMKTAREIDARIAAL